MNLVDVLRSCRLSQPVATKSEPSNDRRTAPESVRSRHVARYADYWDLADSSPDEIRHFAAILESECKAIGRDPTEIARMHEEVIRPGDPAGGLTHDGSKRLPLSASHTSWSMHGPRATHVSSSRSDR